MFVSPLLQTPMYGRITSMHDRRFLLIVVLLVACANHTSAQQVLPETLWQPVTFDQRPASVITLLSMESMQAGVAYRLDSSTLAEVFAAGPLEGVTLPLPLADGTFRSFTLLPSATFPSELKNKYDRLDAWEGVDVDTGDLHVVLTRAGDTLFAEIQDRTARTLILPFADGVHRVRNRTPDDHLRSWQCAAKGTNERPREFSIGTWGGEERTLRLAIACTGEYAKARGETKSQVLSAVVFTVQRLNQIYSSELGIRFRLVDNVDNLLFMDPMSDPFTNANAETLIRESQRTIDKIIGNDQYDIGHTLSTGAGGLASPGAGQKGLKALGVTGMSEPYADPFDVDYFAHEIAHQLGANHTFNGRDQSCLPANRNASTAFEPGSGSTILGYAGICGIDNLQSNSDPYFHSASLAEIRDYIQRFDHLLAPPIAAINSPPVVDIGPDIVIPMGTPFRLRPDHYFDPDGDSLKFCWEELDLGPSANLGVGNPAVVPLFRSFAPTWQPTRTLPRLQTILNGIGDPAERLPTVGRTMRFRLTVRDNSRTGAGIATGDRTVTVSDTAGPFTVTFPLEPILRARLMNVTWDVAGTNVDPVACGSVNILLSVNDGRTFPYSISSHTPNDGSELVDIPFFGEMPMRILIESSDGRFFAVSSRFTVLRSETTISFVPRTEDDTLVDAESAFAILRGGRFDSVLTVERGALRLHDSSGVTSFTEVGAIAWLRRSRIGQRAHRCLAVGDRDALFTFLSTLGGKPTEHTQVAVYTLARDGSMYEGFSRSTGRPGAFISLGIDRFGAWTMDVELIERVKEIEELQRALVQQLPYHQRW